MGAPLTDDKFLNGRTANRTGLAFAIVHTEMVLELAAAIDPIEARAVAADGLPQNGLDRFVEFIRLLLCH